MASHDSGRFRLMTYNINGRGGNDVSELDALTEVIAEARPDILAIQEAAEFQDADGAWYGAAARIERAAAIEERVFFGSVISLREHLHVGKRLFVEGLFDDWLDWRKGNALLSRWEFVRLGDPSKPGAPRHVPLYKPPIYEGTRDTEPRYALIARAGRAPTFPYVVNVHLTTLVGERAVEASAAGRPRRVEEAELLRFRQARRILDLLRSRVLERGEVVFLLGDFNATPAEPAIAAVLEQEGGFVRLEPAVARGTHGGTVEPIDHIFVFPADRLMEYDCWIVDTPAARQASDHLPVVADVRIDQIRGSAAREESARWQA